MAHTLTLFDDEASTGESDVYRIVTPEPEAIVSVQASGGYANKQLQLLTSLDGDNWSTAIDDLASGDMYVGPVTGGQIKASIGAAGTGTVTLKLNVSVGSFAKV